MVHEENKCTFMARKLHDNQLAKLQSLSLKNYKNSFHGSTEKNINNNTSCNYPLGALKYFSAALLNVDFSFSFYKVKGDKLNA